MTDRLIYGAVMFVAGVGIPILAALNAQLVETQGQLHDIALDL